MQHTAPHKLNNDLLALVSLAPYTSTEQRVRRPSLEVVKQSNYQCSSSLVCAEGCISPRVSFASFISCMHSSYHRHPSHHLASRVPTLSQAAWTLVSLSTAPTAVRACAQTYATLLNSSSDNNVKLIVLDRLSELKKHHTKVVQEILMDILRALSSPNIDICKKVLALAIDMVGPRNIEEVRHSSLSFFFWLSSVFLSFFFCLIFFSLSSVYLILRFFPYS